ncbi:flagellar protein FliS [Oceanospirillum multiglobuliferum]|uniref:Flagellar export chaperone FliS n=1 Tax=Oceanospirillum multiglobuliferum TaxID=64969 RepID=A0A1T4L377_9GAMM|nr:flagellar export chaperone FliS [Oceanospirillum multiglobuliferum]OPX56821.1 flagellar export chaperone FliS [Oceanospirillum multiglobuliferum]SJZ49103.1 flagellar protein FliS [Oceanospirillum multiglobuliferum]
MRRALQQYQTFNLEAEINSASPHRITQMLFEGCLRFLRRASVAITNKDYENKAIYIAKSEAIIVALAGTINSSANEELANNLKSLYDYCLECLLDASLNMDASKVKNAEDVIFKIKSGWDQIS